MTEVNNISNYKWYELCVNAGRLSIELNKIAMRVSARGLIGADVRNRAVSTWKELFDMLGIKRTATRSKFKKLIIEYDIIRAVKMDSGKRILIVNPFWIRRDCIQVSDFILDSFSDSKYQLDMNNITIVDERRAEWSSEVKKANGYTCDICGSTKELHSHHLYNYADYTKLRYDISNGVCLCRQCHIAGFHKQYGRKNNTKEQYEEFKKGNKIYRRHVCL